MIVIKKLSILMVFIIVTACSPYRYSRLSTHELDELRTLCEKDAGLKIYKTVEAEGYYDAYRKGGAIGPLIPSGYRFVEFCDYDSKRPSFDEPGCWRLTKISRETGQCNEIVDKTLWKSGSDATIGFREKNCIAVEKIEKPTARYSYHSELKSWPDKNGISVYMKNTETIMDAKNNEIIGSYITYLFDKKPPYSVPTACSDFIENFPSYIEAKFVDSVIEPIQGEIK